MKTNKYVFGKLIIALGMMIVITACNPLPGDEATPTPTVTPTPKTADSPTLTPTPTITIGDISTPTFTPNPNPCEGLSGVIEMQILVGPGEAVGLEPYAVGSIPFTVKSEGEAFVIEGGGAIAYQQTLVEEWGTFSVELDEDATINGDCQGDQPIGVLHMIIEVSGEQYVEVRSEGYQGDFPWSGTHEFDLSFPIEEGAAAEGEGWVFVLHLDK